MSKKECSVEGCLRPHLSKGKCAQCYALLRQRRIRTDPVVKQRLDDNNRTRASGWTRAAEAKAVNSQRGCCAICPRELGEGRATQRDHYETVAGVRVSPIRNGRGAASTVKHTRGLLCAACNASLGRYEAVNGQRAAGLRIAQYEDYIARYGG